MHSRLTLALAGLLASSAAHAADCSFPAHAQHLRGTLVLQP